MSAVAGRSRYSIPSVKLRSRRSWRSSGVKLSLRRSHLSRLTSVCQSLTLTQIPVSCPVSRHSLVLVVYRKQLTSASPQVCCACCRNYLSDQRSSVHAFQDGSIATTACLPTAEASVLCILLGCSRRQVSTGVRRQSALNQHTSLPG